MDRKAVQRLTEGRAVTSFYDSNPRRSAALAKLKLAMISPPKVVGGSNDGPVERRDGAPIPVALALGNSITIPSMTTHGPKYHHGYK